MTDLPAKIHVSGHDDLRKALNRGARGVSTRARAALGEIGRMVVESARANLTARGKVDTGRLRDSLGYRVVDRRGRMHVAIGVPPEMQVVASVIEHGRTPGSRMPPAGVLLGWMSRHGIPPEAEFPIRRAIGRNGLRGQPFPFLGPALIDNRDAIFAALDEVLVGVVDDVSRG